MKVTIIAPDVSWYKGEVFLIGELCRFEGIAVDRDGYRDRHFKSLFKGNGVIVHINHDGKENVVRGFWGLAEFLLKSGLLQC